MLRRNLFEILEDYLATPNDLALKIEAFSAGDALVLAAKKIYADTHNKNIDQVGAAECEDHIKKVILDEAKQCLEINFNKNTYFRLINSKPKLDKKKFNIDYKYIFQVTENEKKLIDDLIYSHISAQTNCYNQSSGIHYASFMFINRQEKSNYEYIPDFQATSINESNLEIRKNNDFLLAQKNILVNAEKYTLFIAKHNAAQLEKLYNLLNGDQFKFTNSTGIIQIKKIIVEGMRNEHNPTKIIEEIINIAKRKTNQSNLGCFANFFQRINN